MKNQNQEILAIIILGALLALMLVGFIVAMLFLYQKRQNQYKKEMAVMQEEYDQQILRVQFEMQEATLKEIANKLHDGLKNNIVSIIQRLNLIGFQISRDNYKTQNLAEDINKISEDLLVVKDEVRLTSHSLSTDRIRQVGLIDAIKFEVKRLKQSLQMQINFNLDESKNYFFSETDAVYLFRMFQEIIGNVISHSKATHLEININLSQQSIFTLEINDNGVGFDLNEKKKSKQSGMGLLGMQKRALQIGADFTILTNKTQGTQVKIQLPLLTKIENKTKDDKQERQTKYSFN
ncbi:MAG: sensor histidine kinase [Chitinophagaceae bacterium]